MKDTIRVIVTNKCNLKCSYCCNNKPELMRDFKSINARTLIWKLYMYDSLCITGGEPLLDLHTTLFWISIGKKLGLNVYLYTNGILLDMENPLIKKIYNLVDGISLGLHAGHPFALINKLKQYKKIRFQVWDKYEKEFRKHYPDVNIKFWKMNDCDRNNEDRYILNDS